MKEQCSAGLTLAGQQVPKKPSSQSPPLLDRGRGNITKGSLDKNREDHLQIIVTGKTVSVWGN